MRRRQLLCRRSRTEMLATSTNILLYTEILENPLNRDTTCSKRRREVVIVVRMY